VNLFIYFAIVVLNNELILHSAVALVIAFLTALAGIKFHFYVLEKTKFKYKMMVGTPESALPKYKTKGSAGFDLCYAGKDKL